MLHCLSVTVPLLFECYILALNRVLQKIKLLEIVAEMMNFRLMSIFECYMEIKELKMSVTSLICHYIGILNVF